MTPYPIIGMNPGNSYFKDAEVEHLFKRTVGEYGRAAVFVADIPAIATYMSYGYTENRARNKAIPKGNNLKNRTLRIAQDLGIADKVHVIDWETEVQNDPAYLARYAAVEGLYGTSTEFAAAVNDTTGSVLDGSGRDIPDREAAVKVAVHYLLSEIAFLEFAPELLGAEQVVYVYHRNWPVYERYVNGAYDGKTKPYLEFRLLEHPTETYRAHGGNEQPERISGERVLRCAFTNYPPGLIEDETTGELSGIFHDILTTFAAEQNWRIECSEEVGYGVIQDGLAEGRFDIFAAPVWPTPERAGVASFSQPLYHSDVGMWVREADFDQAKEAGFTGNSFVRAAIKEGDVTDSIVSADFPHWRRVRVTQLTDTEELLRFVANGDVDVTFAEQYLVDLFNATSPVKLANAAERPVCTFDNCFMLAQESDELRKVLDGFIKRNKGLVSEFMRKYAPEHAMQGMG
jgi:tRNA-dependent cyclodipeptide synthase